MRLSESLRKNIMQTSPDGIINMFKISKRRDVLFFEEILAKYIKMCEDAGYRPQMKQIAKEWAFLYVKNFLPEFMEKIPKSVLLNSVMKKVLMNIGLLSDLKANIKNGEITLSAYEEAMTRCIGENEFCIGLWEGVLSGLYRRDAEALSAGQSGEKSVYALSLKYTPFDIESKGKGRYTSMNRTFGENGELKRYLRMRIIVLENNRMYFRGKSVVLGENTLFHLFGQKKILIGRVAGISHSCFRDIIDPGSSPDSKIALLKNILQVFGWGEIKIMYGANGITVKIANPPYGMQKGEDNWIFLANAVLGYIFLVDKRYRISGVKTFRWGLEISYSIEGIMKNKGFVGGV
jgi:hypothetical protein